MCGLRDADMPARYSLDYMQLLRTTADAFVRLPVMDSLSSLMLPSLPTITRSAAAARFFYLAIFGSDCPAVISRTFRVID